MKTIFNFCLIAMFCVVCHAQTGSGTTNTNNAAVVPNYSQLVGAARKAMDEGRLPDGLLASMAAMAADDTRFEAYAVAALVKMKQGQPDDAKRFLAEARKRAPQEKQSKLDELERLISQETSAAGKSPAASSSAPVTAAPAVPDEAQRKLAALKLIVADADKAQNSADRQKYLNEFLDKSKVYVQEEDSNSIPIWTLRGLAAVEMDKPDVGWEAGHRLIDLKADESDAKAKQLLAQLDRKNWLTMPTAGDFVGKWTFLHRGDNSIIIGDEPFLFLEDSIEFESVDNGISVKEIKKSWRIGQEDRKMSEKFVIAYPPGEVEQVHRSLFGDVSDGKKAIEINGEFVSSSNIFILRQSCQDTKGTIIFALNTDKTKLVRFVLLNQQDFASLKSPPAWVITDIGQITPSLIAKVITMPRDNVMLDGSLIGGFIVHLYLGNTIWSHADVYGVKEQN